MRLAVTAMGLYTPRFPTIEAWREGAESAEAVAPTGAALDRRNRRLASPLMRALADVYHEAADHGGVDITEAASVFASSLGEASTMIGLLDQMWAKEEAPSPMAFAASVHNAASGAVSISNKNHAFTTSIAADHDTVAMSLVEAFGIAKRTGGEVLIACGDEAAPEKLVDDENQWTFLCAALALSADPDDPRRIARIDLPSMSQPRDACFLAPLDKRLAGNPVVGILDLVDAILAGHEGPVALDRGRGRGWSVVVSKP